MQRTGGAPVAATSELVIAADPEPIWRVLTTIAAWPDWNPTISRATLVGPLRPGTVFQWQAGRHTITSTLQEVEPPMRITWEGRAAGLAARHAYTLTAEATGTRVRSAETWDGLLARLLRARLQRTLQRALDDGLRCLQAEVARMRA